MQLLFPKKVKYSKQHRGRLKTNMIKPIILKNGEFGLISMNSVWLSSKQIESARKILAKATKKSGQFWINIFPDKPITMRVPESRMGSGKGNVKYWVSVIKKGITLFEVKGLSSTISINLLKHISYKLPLKTKIINNVS